MIRKKITLVLFYFLSIDLCADELYWIVYDPVGYSNIHYPSAEAACAAGIKFKESKADLSRYIFRSYVDGNFYRGGSYVSNNFGKTPADPGFINSSRDVSCSHETTQIGSPFWHASNPAGAHVRLQGDDCAGHQVWNPETFGCQNPQINLGGPLGENNSCDISNTPFTGRPINIATGNKFYRFADYQQSGSDTLLFVRYYNSAVEHNENWSHSYARKLIIESGLDRIVVERDDGKKIQFEKNSSAWVGPIDREESLEEIVGGYRLINSNNTIENYNSLGQLYSIVDRNGRTTNLTYSGNQIIVNQVNRSLIIDKDGAGLLSSVVTPDNTIIEYVWEEGTNPRLLQVFFPDQTSGSNLDNDSQNYEYSDQFPHHISKISDTDGLAISIVGYDSRGRAISSQTADGIDSSSLQFDASGSTTVTNALGKQTTYRFTQINGVFRVIEIEGHQSVSCAAANKNYTYYPSGLLQSKTDWKGNTTSYQYNSRNLESSRTEALDTTEERTVTTEWHPTFNLRTKITEPGRETIFIYDTQGRLLSQTSSDTGKSRKITGSE